MNRKSLHFRPESKKDSRRLLISVESSLIISCRNHTKKTTEQSIDSLVTDRNVGLLPSVRVIYMYTTKKKIQTEFLEKTENLFLRGE